MKRVLCVTGLSLASMFAAKAMAETITFNFAQVGQSYLALLPADNPAVGQEAVVARVYLDVEVFPGSDAANFFTDIAFPIEPFPGNYGGLALSGKDLNWQGSGVFHYFEETTRFNGVFISTRFGAETPGQDFDGQILETSRIEFDYVAALAGDMNCDGVVSVADIGGFVLALTDPADYAAQFPDCDINNADVGGDGTISVADIGPFVGVLTGG